MIEKKWIPNSWYGHWQVTNGTVTVNCDESELEETIKELEENE